MIEKLLTISIAAYNVEEYLEETLQSLVCEKNIMDKLEVIIVDDGSKDMTALIAQKYVEMYPDTFVLIKKENGGHGSTLNVASANAHGKYFRMLDGDDWYDTVELEKYIDALENINVDCVITPYTKVYNHKKIIIDTHPWENDKDYVLSEIVDKYEEIDTEQQIYAHEIAIKTSIIKKYGLNLSERCMYVDKEYDLFAALYSRTFTKLPYNIYQYRLGDDAQSVGFGGRKKYLMDGSKVVFSMLNTLKENKENIVSDSHKNYLYMYILSTADFFCEGLSYVGNVKQSGAYLTEFMDKLYCSDESFAELFLKEYSYCWWKWMFSLDIMRLEKCVIFGAGIYGEKVQLYLKCNEKEPIAFADNNKCLWNTQKQGYIVVSPEQLLTTYCDSNVIIAVKNYSEQINEQLLSMGVSRERIIAFK